MSKRGLIVVVLMRMNNERIDIVARSSHNVLQWLDMPKRNKNNRRQRYLAIRSSIMKKPRTRLERKYSKEEISTKSDKCRFRRHLNSITTRSIWKSEIVKLKNRISRVEVKIEISTTRQSTINSKC
jgi:hypothetical protein